MKAIVTNLIFLLGLLYFPPTTMAQNQKQSKNELEELTQTVLNYHFGLAKEIDADEFSHVTYNNIVLRKNDQFSVVSIYANTIIPYGKYIFENPLRTNLHYPPIHFKYWMTQVRSPETGLYGFIDPDGKEIVPLMYNEVTPVAPLKDASIPAFSIGTVHCNDGTKEHYFISPFLENPTTLIKNKNIGNGLATQKNYHYFVYPDRVTNDGFTRHFSLFGDTLSISRRSKKYIGGQLFKVDSSFNGLRKMELIDYKDSVIAPFQLSDKFSMTHFQPIGGDKYVSFLTGQHGTFDFALMNEKGEIYSRLKSGEGDLTNFRIDHGEEIIDNNYVLIYAQDQSGKNDRYLWDIREESKIIKIEDIFLKKNGTDYGIGYPDVLNYNFNYISRSDGMVKFRFLITYKPIEELMARMPWGIKNYSSGFGGGELISFTVSGTGVMDQDTGELVFRPIYSKIENIDHISRTAYAEMKIEDLEYKGFIHSPFVVNQPKVSQFIILLRD